jgi:hypothetical protein
VSYVYVITDEERLEENEAGYLTHVSVVKIGFTGGDVFQRISQLQTGNPRPLQLIYLFKFVSVDMAKQAEKMCHSKLRAHGLTGEWFHYCRPVFKVLNALAELSELEAYTYPSDEAIEAAMAFNKNALAVVNG